MRAIDVHVHPMNDSYSEAARTYLPAARRLFKGKWDARSDEAIADDFRRDDCLALPIAWTRATALAAAFSPMTKSRALADASRMSFCQVGQWWIPGQAASA